MGGWLFFFFWTDLKNNLKCNRKKNASASKNTGTGTGSGGGKKEEREVDAERNFESGGSDSGVHRGISIASGSVKF